MYPYKTKFLNIFKQTTFRDMTRNKLTVQSVAPINHKEYNKHLLKELQELTGIGSSNWVPCAVRQNTFPIN